MRPLAASSPSPTHQFANFVLPVRRRPRGGADHRGGLIVRQLFDAALPSHNVADLQGPHIRKINSELGLLLNKQSGPAMLTSRGRYVCFCSCPTWRHGRWGYLRMSLYLSLKYCATVHSIVWPFSCCRGNLNTRAFMEQGGLRKAACERSVNSDYV